MQRQPLSLLERRLSAALAAAPTSHHPLPPASLTRFVRAATTHQPPPTTLRPLEPEFPPRQGVNIYEALLVLAVVTHFYFHFFLPTLQATQIYFAAFTHAGWIPMELGWKTGMLKSRDAGVPRC